MYTLFVHTIRTYIHPWKYGKGSARGEVDINEHIKTHAQWRCITNDFCVSLVCQPHDPSNCPKKEKNETKDMRGARTCGGAGGGEKRGGGGREVKRERERDGEGESQRERGA